MSIGTPTDPLLDSPAPAISAEPIWRLTVEQYHGMLRTGILADGDPIELLEGLLIPKMTKSTHHRAATKLVAVAIERVLPQGWYVDTQEPITTGDSEPEPDVAVVRGSTRDYLTRHPGPEETALVVEVSDTTLARDRGTKKRLYARAGIAVYWIVNLVDRAVEVYSHPSTNRDECDYLPLQQFVPGAQIPLVLEGREVGRVAVDDLLP